MNTEKLIQFCIVKLVDKPEFLAITKKEEGDKTIFEIRVAPTDLARVIGKEGRTFKALRALVILSNTEHPQDIVIDTAA